MDEPSEKSRNQKAKQASYKSKVSVHNNSKFAPKPKIRYGAIVDKLAGGYLHNGIWRQR